MREKEREICKNQQEMAGMTGKFDRILFEKKSTVASTFAFH